MANAPRPHDADDTRLQPISSSAKRSPKRPKQLNRNQEENLAYGYYPIVLYVKGSVNHPVYVSFVGQFERSPEINSLKDWFYWRDRFVQLPHLSENKVFQKMLKFTHRHEKGKKSDKAKKPDEDIFNNLPGLVVGSPRRYMEDAIEDLEEIIVPWVEDNWFKLVRPTVDRKEARQILHHQTGTIYENARAAADDLGLDPNNIRKVCRGQRKRTQGQTFAYLDRNTRRVLPPEYSVLIAPVPVAKTEAELRQEILKFLEVFDPGELIAASWAMIEDRGTRSLPLTTPRVKRTFPKSREILQYKLVDMKIDLEIYVKKDDWDRAIKQYYEIKNLLDPEDYDPRLRQLKLQGRVRTVSWEDISDDFADHIVSQSAFTPPLPEKTMLAEDDS